MYKIDLHNLRYEDAKRFLIRQIESRWGNCEILEIITGHSNKMRKVATDLLDEYSLDYKIGGTLGTNTGVIQVEME